MYAMRYGAVPVTRPVGGLKDTVEEGPAGSGFMFAEATSAGLARCVDRATAWYDHAEDWAALRRRAMERDFGWERSARRYLEIYLDLIGEDVSFRPRLRPVLAPDPAATTLGA
jgi:starch synthase